MGLIMHSDRDEEIANLVQALKDKDKSLETAAEYGNSLLETRTNLEEMLHQTHIDYEKKIENIEQEKYSLQLKLELLQKNEKRLEYCMQEEKQALQNDHEKQIEMIQAEFKAHLNALKLKNSELQNELNENELVCNLNKDTMDKQQALLSEMKQINQHRTKNDSLSPEIAELVSENERLQMESSILQKETSLLSHQVEQLSLQLKGIENTNEMLREGKELAEAEKRSYFEALQQCQQDNRELKSEIEQLQSFPQDPNSRGNSLFAEVEDKRIAAEKKLVSMQVKLKCTERKYTQQVNYCLQLKTQVAQLLQASGSGADRDQIQRLERSLLNSREDVKSLMDQVADLERKLSHKSDTTLNELRKDSTQDKDFTSFLENILKDKETEIEKLKGEVTKCRVHLMAESRKVTETEHNIYSANNERDKLKSLCLKQKLEITRLKLKCGEEVLGKRNMRPGKVEKVSDILKDCSNEDKENELDLLNTFEGKNLVAKPKSPAIAGMSTTASAEVRNDVATKPTKRDTTEVPGECTQQ